LGFLVEISVARNPEKLFQEYKSPGCLLREFARRQLSATQERELPLLLNTSLSDALPQPLFEAAEEARKDVEGQPDYVVRRKIREHLDKEKLRQKRVGRVGIEALEHDLRLALETSSQKKG